MSMSQMVASEEPPSPKVPLLAKFAKPRTPVMSSVSCESWTCHTGRNLICDRIDADVTFGRKVI